MEKNSKNQLFLISNFNQFFLIQNYFQDSYQCPGNSPIDLSKQNSQIHPIERIHHNLYCKTEICEQGLKYRTLTDSWKLTKAVSGGHGLKFDPKDLNT